MAYAEPRHDRPPVFDPTREPDTHGSPAERGRYWGAALVGVALLVFAVALVIWWLTPV